MNVQVLISIFILAFFLSCDNTRKIDKDGGFYNKKTGKYQYVFPPKANTNEQKTRKPKVGEIQQFYGVVAKIEDSRSIWIKIESRKVYQRLAQSLSRRNRNDKEKKLRVILKYVNPVIVNSSKISFRRKWEKYVVKKLERELLTKQVSVYFEYHENALQFTASIVKEKKGSGIQNGRNTNLWMISEGLSFYIFEKGLAIRHKEFEKAQELAKRKKKGLWRY